MCTDIPTCTCTQGCTKASCVQKVHNTCEEQLTFISLDTDVQKSRGILFRKCTIFVTNDLLLLAWTLTYRKVGVFCSENVQYLSWLTLYWLGRWCTGKWGCSVQSNLCFTPSQKFTIFVTNDLLLLAWTLMYRKVGVFYSKSVQYVWWMTYCHWLGHWCTEKWVCLHFRQWDLAGWLQWFDG